MYIYILIIICFTIITICRIMSKRSRVLYMVKSFAMLTPIKLFIRISEFTMAYDCLYKH